MQSISQITIVLSHKIEVFCFCSYYSHNCLLFLELYSSDPIFPLLLLQCLIAFFKLMSATCWTLNPIKTVLSVILAFENLALKRAFTLTWMTRYMLSQLALAGLILFIVATCQHDFCVIMFMQVLPLYSLEVFESVPRHLNFKIYYYSHLCWLPIVKLKMLTCYYELFNFILSTIRLCIAVWSSKFYDVMFAWKVVIEVYNFIHMLS